MNVGIRRTSTFKIFTPFKGARKHGDQRAKRPELRLSMLVACSGLRNEENGANPNKVLYSELTSTLNDYVSKYTYSFPSVNREVHFLYCVKEFQLNDFVLGAT